MAVDKDRQRVRAETRRRNRYAFPMILDDSDHDDDGLE
jgi:hypothetical protein